MTGTAADDGSIDCQIGLLLLYVQELLSIARRTNHLFRIGVQTPGPVC